MDSEFKNYVLYNVHTDEWGEEQYMSPVQAGLLNMYLKNDRSDCRWIPFKRKENLQTGLAYETFSKPTF